VSGRATLAASLTLAGGVAAGVGSFLSWAEVSAGPLSEQANGISGWEGKATLIAGVVMAVAAIRVLTGGFDAPSRLRSSASIGGLAAAGVGLYTAVTAKEQLLDAAEADLPRSVVQDALDSGLLELSISLGLYVVIAGGALGVLGALVSFGARESAAAGSGSGLTGWAAPAASPSPGGPPTAPLSPGASPWATPARPDPGRDPPA
jgi:hypothetical protein